MPRPLITYSKVSRNVTYYTTTNVYYKIENSLHALNKSASVKRLCNFQSIHVMGYASCVFHSKALYTKQSQSNHEYLTN